MLEDWRNVDLNSITKQTLYTMEDSREEHKKLIIQLYQEFDHLLEEQSPIESYIEWLDSMVDSCVVKVAGKIHGSLKKVAQQFLLMWSCFGTRVIRDMTLHSAPSFGSFHLIHLMFDDYVLYVLESLHCQERANELMRAMKAERSTADRGEEIMLTEPTPPSSSPGPYSPAKSVTSAEITSAPSPGDSHSPEYTVVTTTSVTTAGNNPSDAGQQLPCMRSSQLPPSSSTQRMPVYPHREEHGYTSGYNYGSYSNQHHHPIQSQYTGLPHEPSITAPLHYPAYHRSTSQKLCEGLIRILGKNVQASCQTMCLETLRILSRDKKVLGPVATKQGMLVLAQLAALQVTGESVPEILEVGLVVEALKCLCNVIFNSVAAQQLSAELNFASGLCARLRMYTGQGLSHEVALFSLRLLFLLSALRTDVRSCLRQELKAVDLLIEILEHILSIKWVGKYEVATDLEAPPLPLEDNERTMEALKTLFNLTLSDFNDEDGAHQLRLITAIMRHVLMIKTQTEDKTEELHSLVYVCQVDNLLKYTGYGNAAGLLAARGLLAGGRGGGQYSEDEDSDTEEYKYTGYGNAAGLLAARGLLAGGRGGGQYSEDEDSDTEEYRSVKPFINPITGHVEEPMPNPIEEMTEEQKEYEALKLVNMFDQLSRRNTCTVSVSAQGKEIK
ncbi:UNVERIFIED_CONTAM: hypothetical protein FKN15_029436 [Acipenser sinensis]